MLNRLLRRGERERALDPAEVFRTFLRTIEAVARGASAPAPASAAPSRKAACATAKRPASGPRPRVRPARSAAAVRPAADLPAP
ncbi:MAG: hypothetical protein O9972_44460 [Burkholderiales bacterium]|nr:hypothetical protein [Burkholderiales bacterium]